MRKIFALVDCDNFYVSCERVFNPALAGRPVVVLSNNDGCVIARSNEAKELGIEMGLPAFKHKEFFTKHNVGVLSSNYALYGDMSGRVMAVLGRFTPEMEMYSIDEAFLSLTGFGSLDRTGYCRHIRSTVKQWTGMPISVGIGPSKTLAKVAHKIAKRDRTTGGVFDITDHPRVDELLERIPVRDVWGVGGRYARMLGRSGIATALGLKNAPDRWLREKMTVVGLRTALELRGEPCIELEVTRPGKKAIVISRSFGQAVTTLRELEEAAAAYVARAAEKLRAQKSAACWLHVFIETNPFKAEPQYSNFCTTRLAVPTGRTPELVRACRQGVASIFKTGFSYKRAGVMLAGIVPERETQLNFLAPTFDDLDDGRKKRLAAIVDRLNARFGTDTVRYAAAGSERPWRMRQEHRSGRFTTRWKELPTVAAKGSPADRTQQDSVSEKR